MVVQLKQKQRFVHKNILNHVYEPPDLFSVFNREITAYLAVVQPHIATVLSHNA